MRRLRVLFLPAASALLAVSLAAVPPPDDARIEAVENGLRPPVLVEGDKTWTLAERMKHYGVNGVSIAVIRDSKVEWAKGYGLADVEGKQPVTASTLFQAGSISKPVSAMAALVLVEDGKLKLNADINTFLTSWKVPANDHTAKIARDARGAAVAHGGPHGPWLSGLCRRRARADRPSGSGRRVSRQHGAGSGRHRPRHALQLLGRRLHDRPARHDRRDGTAVPGASAASSCSRLSG